jgi:hypothetical protein
MALQEFNNIVNADVTASFDRFDGVESHMRREYGIIQLEQWVVFRRRLLLENIKPCIRHSA